MLTGGIYFTDYRDAMTCALDIAEQSNCNSRHLGTVIVDANGMLLTTGYNSTLDPVCLMGVCHKKLEGAKSGERSDFCRAIHSEEMAARKLIWLRQNNTDITEPVTAVCAMGHPCSGCLSWLKAADVKKMVLIKDTFYTPEDEEYWNRLYKNFFKVKILGK
jgi:deoxycytidylate deaminase